MKKSFLTLAIATMPLSTSLYASKLTTEDLEACRASEEARRNGAYWDANFITNWSKDAPLPSPQIHEHQISSRIQTMLDALLPQMPGPHRNVQGNALAENAFAEIPPQDAPFIFPEAPMEINDEEASSQDSNHEEEEIVVPLPPLRPTIENPCITGNFSSIDRFLGGLGADDIMVTHFHNGSKQYNTESSRGQITFEGNIWNIELRTHISQGHGKREFQPKLIDLTQEDRNVFLGRSARHWNIINRNRDIFTYTLIQWHGALKYTYGTMTLSPAF